MLPFSILAPQVGQSSPILALMYSKAFYETAKFRRFRWRRDRQKTVNDTSSHTISRRCNFRGSNNKFTVAIDGQQ